MPTQPNRKYWYSGIDGAKGRKEESRFMLICRATVECVYWIFLSIELHSSVVLDHRFDFRFQEENQILPGANFIATQRDHVQLIHNLTAFFSIENEENPKEILLNLFAPDNCSVQLSIFF